MKTKLFAAAVLLFLANLSGFAQWLPANSGTTKNLNGIRLFDSGVGFVVGDAGTILKTTDAGATWAPLTSGTTQSLRDLYFFSDNEGVAVGDNGLILRTTDGGANWTTITSGVRDSLHAVSFSGANGVCGGTSQDILYSTDSGATWHVSQKGQFGGGFFGAQMLSPTLGFVAGQNSIFQAFVGVTVDGGVTWSFHNFYFNGNEGTCDDVFFFNATTGITSGAVFDFTGAIARTTDGAVNWSTTIYPLALQGIDFPTTTTGWTVGYGGTILKSTDAGATFTPQTSGTSSDLYDVSFASDGVTGLAAGQAGTILRTTNGGAADSLALVSAASRRGPFEIDLPLSGSPGIECRISNNHHLTIVFTFDHAVTSVESGAATCGRFGDLQVNLENPDQVLATYNSGPCNGEQVTLSLHNIQDEDGDSLADASVTIGLLVGDVTGDGSVDEADVQATEMALGQTTNESNFRADIDTSGAIDRNDARIVRRKGGSVLLPR